MNRTRAVVALAAAAVATGGLIATASPAAAYEDPNAPICMTNSPTPLYAGFIDHIGIGHQLTLSEGRGFRVHSWYDSDPGVDWAYGHGAQYPNTDGWVRADRLRC